MSSAQAISIGRKIENAFSTTALALMATVPVIALIAREVMGQSVTGSKPFVEHLTFSVTFLGAALAAGSGQLIAMSTPSLLPQRFAGAARIVTSGIGATISVAMAYASIEVLRIDYAEFAESGATVAFGIP